METITKYKAIDGTEFANAKKCLEHDKLVQACEAAMKPLGDEPRISGCNYVQHKREDCLQAKRNMLTIIRDRLGSNYPVFEHPDDEIHPLSFVGRLVDDSNVKPICKAWGRLSRISWNTYREYEQPYYARNEGKDL